MIDTLVESDSAERRPSILMLTHRLPFPPDKGDRIRTYHVLRELSRVADVDLLSLADEPAPQESLYRLSELCREVRVVELGRARWLRAAAALAGGRSASEGAFDSPVAREIVRRWVEEGRRYDCSLASASSVAPYLRLAPLADVPAVVDLVDVDSEKWMEYGRNGRGPKAWLHRLEGRRVRRLEAEVLGWARAATLVSQAEADLLRNALGEEGELVVATNGVDLESYQPADPSTDLERAGRCVFVGALDYRPNIEGITWFCREIWAELRRRTPGATLTVVGRRPTDEVRRLADIPGVEVVGQVPDVRPYVMEAAVAVVPLRLARGVQNKVLEAMAMGKAVVASPQAASGLGVEPGRHLIVAENETEWVDQLSALLGNDARRRELGEAARAHVEDEHQWDKCLAPLIDRMAGSDIVSVQR